MKHLSMALGEIPVTEKLSEDQIPNNTGGYANKIDEFSMLERFLICGTEGGTYYVSEQKITSNNCNNIKACISKDGKRTVDAIVNISVSARAAKNGYAIFALAMACSYGDLETKRYGFSKLHDVCRTGTHLFEFTEYISKMRGWGRTLTNAIADWYLSKQPSQLAYQVVKYQSRAIEGQPSWSNYDLLRKSHPKAIAGSEHELIFRWITKNWSQVYDNQVTISQIVKPGKPPIREEIRVDIPSSLRIIEGYELAKNETNPKKLAQLISDYGLTHEMIPTEGKNSPEVWDALLQKMPMTAMIRNLGNMSKAGILGPNSANEILVRNRLTSQEDLRKAKIHPISLMSAKFVYSSGKGILGSNTWNVNQQISSALEDSFYLSFGVMAPTGMRFLIGQDVSGSMSYSFGTKTGLGLTCAQVSAVMSMVTVKTEPYLFYGGFSNVFKPLPITKNMSFENVCKIISDNNFGSTAPSVAVQYAIDNKIPVDAFVMYTDNEANEGPHVSETLAKYRRKTGIQAKMVVVGITATRCSIANPNDPLMVDIAGFDSNTPSFIENFVRK